HLQGLGLEGNPWLCPLSGESLLEYSAGHLAGGRSQHLLQGLGHRLLGSVSPEPLHGGTAIGVAQVEVEGEYDVAYVLGEKSVTVICLLEARLSLIRFSIHRRPHQVD